jgi:hypothetical protein
LNAVFEVWMGCIRMNMRHEGVRHIVSITVHPALNITLACVNMMWEGAERFKGVGDIILDVVSGIVHARAWGEGVGLSQP